VDRYYKTVQRVVVVERHVLIEPYSSSRIKQRGKEIKKKRRKEEKRQRRKPNRLLHKSVYIPFGE
jgi:hypothetical protein